MLCPFLSVLLAACAAPRPLATPTPRAAITTLAPTAFAPTPRTTTPPAAPTATPPTAPTLLPPVTHCLPREPQSLYRYAPPEAGRAEVLALLEDAPVVVRDFAYQPRLLQALPSLANGDAAISEISIKEGDFVVDALDRVVTLTLGTELAWPAGLARTYAGGPLRLPQLRVTFRLKPALRWGDGAPLTAADSVFAYTLARDLEAFDPQQRLAERTTTYRALDDLTLEWIGLPGYLDAGFATFLWPPLPQHNWIGETADNEKPNRQPLGWGRYLLTEWIPGQALSFAPNPFYTGNAARSELLTLRFGGDCAPLPKAAIPAQTYLYFNLQTPALASGAIRRALAACVLGPTAFISYLPNTHPRAVFAPLPPVAPPLLPVTLTLVGPQWQADLLTRTQTQLHACGVAVVTRTLTVGEWLGDWPAGAVFGGNFDLALLTWAIGPEPPCALWMTNAIPGPLNPAGANAGGYGNAAFDRACQTARTTLDPAQAAVWYAETQRLWAEGLPAVALP